MMGLICGIDFGRVVNNDIGLVLVIIIVYEVVYMWVIKLIF